MLGTGLTVKLATFTLTLAALDSAVPQEQAAHRTRYLRLPVAERAQPAEKAPEPAAELHVLWNGRIYAGERLLYDPELEDRAALREWLKKTAGKMERKPVGEESPELELPDGLLLIRADDAAPFKYVQGLMVECGASWVGIWRIHLATRSAPKGSGETVEGRLDVSLPVIDCAEAENYREPLELKMLVLAPGDRITMPFGEPWREKEDEPYFFDPATRKLQFQIGPRKMDDHRALAERVEGLVGSAKRDDQKLPMMIDPRVGTVVGDVTGLMDVLIEAGIGSISFASSD